jgi:hypothetical protein
MVKAIWNTASNHKTYFLQWYETDNIESENPTKLSTQNGYFKFYGVQVNTYLV